MTSRAKLHREPTDRDKLYYLYAYGFLSKEILENPDLLPNDKLVYGAIAKYIDAHNCPTLDDGINRIRSFLDIHPRRIEQSIVRLARLGFLVVQIRNGNRRIWTCESWVESHK